MNDYFITRLIYSLKKKYGYPIILHRIISTDLDLETGEKQRTTQFKRVNKVILLPKTILRQTFANIAPVDSQERIIIVDITDLNDFEIKIDDYLIFNETEQYLVSEIDKYSYDRLYILITKMLTGQEIINLADPIVTETLTFSQTVTYELV